jgi:FkbM family methyltransferase
MSLVSQVRHRLAISTQELAALSDWPSRRRMLGLRLEQRRQGELAHPQASAAVPVNVKALDGQPLYIRPRSSDIDMIWDTFVAGWYLPPEEVGARPLRRIVEFGTNIGTGLTGLAIRYPDARLLGVEPDPQNAELARHNLARFGDRVQLVESAIWDTDAELVVERRRREWGLVVRPREPGDPTDWPTVPARSVGSVLSEFDPGEPIDFLFMDIEGTELRVLEAADTSWADRVQSIRVECETEYASDPERCARALSAMGFQVRIEPVSWASFVFGVRPPEAASH